MRIINRHRQQGISGPVWLLIIGLFALIVTSLFNLYPMYYENYLLKSVLTSVQEDPSIDVKSKKAIWESMNKKLYINGVNSIKREHVKMTRKDGKTTISVKYERRADFVGNLGFVGGFSESVVIDR